MPEPDLPFRPIETLRNRPLTLGRIEVYYVLFSDACDILYYMFFALIVICLGVFSIF